MGEPGGQVPASVVEFTAQPRAGNHSPVPVALQRALGDVQCPAHLLAVQSPVVLRWRQTAFQTLGKGGEVSHPFEEPLPTPLPDTYDLFHGLLSVWFNIPATLLCGLHSVWMGTPDIQRSRIRKARRFIFFPIYESLFLQACNRITRATPQKFRPQSDVAVVGVGWRQEGGQTAGKTPVYAVSTLPMRRISRLMFASEIFA